MKFRQINIIYNSKKRNIISEKFFAVEVKGSVTCHAAKKSLQRPMNDQILDYQAMLNVCKEKMSKIKFFEISKETMDEVRKSLEERFSRGKGETVLQVHEAATISYHYHHPNLHTSFRVKTSLMLVLMILIFPQFSNCVISDQ